jgi:SAM-dependent methyltransferase
MEARCASLFRALRCRIYRAWLAALRTVFEFDSWHANAPFSCRPYKGQVVELANSLHPRTVVEVGCGLGDILSRISARERFGFDTDAGVIRAARFLHRHSAHWIHGDAACVARTVPVDHGIDCMIMVNWTHNVSAEQLAALLLPLAQRVRYLILDAIDVNGPGSYKHKHDFRFLDNIARRISILRPANEPRSLIVFEVNR